MNYPRLTHTVEGQITKYSFMITVVNPIALRTAKTPQSFGRSECNRVIDYFEVDIDRNKCLQTSLRHHICRSQSKQHI